MTTAIILLCLAAFLGGFVDSIVVGGGLIQTPAGLVLLPQQSVSAVIGTLKIPAFCGTAFAASQYVRRVKLNYRLLTVMTIVAAGAAYAGSMFLVHISNDFMKSFLFFVLILVAIYTFTNKSFGKQGNKNRSSSTEWIKALLISLVIGFYDGFIGPGAGSFLLLAFIGWLGFDFLHASAYAKFVNLATNCGSIVFFASYGKILYSIAFPMAICNALGGFLGSRLAILKGNAFIRVFFLVVVVMTICRFGWDLIEQ